MGDAGSGVLVGVLEEGKALINLIQLCCRWAGKDIEVPNWVPSLVSEAYFGSELSEVVSCEPVVDDGKALDFKRALLCPLKYGTQGLDALRAAQAIDDAIEHI